jgi:tetratricopeptide (TPR) repeat protein
MAERSAYTVLGLSKGASDQDVKKAYVQLVKKYDPEKHTDRFMVIQEAYNKLKDTKKRAAEDLQTYNPMPGDFLFLDEEKAEDEDAPTEEQVTALREAYNKSAGSDSARDALVRALMRRSHHWFARKNYNECIKDWEEVQRAEPSNVRARANLTIAYGSLGLSYAHHELEDEAVELWEKALKLNPDHTALLQNLALACDKQGQRDKARSYWGEVIRQWEAELEKRGDDEYLRECIIEAHRRQGGSLSAARNTEDKESAVHRLREVLRHRPDDFDARFQLANHYMDEGEHEKAQEELEILMRTHPKNIEAMNLMGWAMLNSGRFDEAFNAWNRALAVDPKNVGARENIVRTRLSLGKQYREQGMFTQALVHLKTLQRYMPNSVEVLMEIAATFDMKGDVRSARMHYEKVLSLDPKNRVARKAVGDLRGR